MYPVIALWWTVRLLLMNITLKTWERASFPRNGTARALSCLLARGESVAWPEAGPGGAGSGCRGYTRCAQHSLGRRRPPWDWAGPPGCYSAQPGGKGVRGCSPRVCEMADGVPGTRGLSRLFSRWWRAAPPWRLFRNTPCRAEFCFPYQKAEIKAQERAEPTGTFSLAHSRHPRRPCCQTHQREMRLPLAAASVRKCVRFYRLVWGRQQRRPSYGMVSFL